MSEFRSCLIGDIAEIVGGGTPSTKNKENFGGDIAWITPKDLSDHDEMYISKGERSITKTGLENSSAKLLPANSILFTSRAPIGYVALARNEITTNQGFKSLILKNDNDPKFFYYLLKNITPQIKSYASGSTFAEISGKVLSTVPIKIPNSNLQKRIGEFMEKFDKKIELNKKTNKALEEIAKALFKSWFIDFDPVRAKEEGRSTGLPKVICDLFPDSFEDSEIGEIPTNWEIKSLDEIATYLNGLALQKYPPKGDTSDLPVIKIAQLRKSNSYDSDKCSSDIEEKYIIRDGDILFSWSGSLLVDIWTGGIGALNQHLFKVSSDIYQKWFILHWTKFHLQEFQRIAKSKATTMGHIQRKNLSEAKIILPPKDLMREINAIFDPLLEREINARLESKFLFQLRDTILPKLISGKIRIPDAEKMIDEVGI